MVKRVLITLAGTIFWIIGIPVAIALFAFYFTYPPRLLTHTALFLFGVFISCVGLSVSLWAVTTLVIHGQGTPIPTYGPKKLITKGPYQYSRNPMTFGLLLYYLGIIIVMHHWIVTAALSLIILIHILYDALIEEKELTQKYGSEYLQYKRNTPFIFPKL